MNELIGLLKHQPKNSRISGLISALEAESTVDLATSADSLEGVWELRWSSATQPWLQQAPWLENLQVLDPATQRGMNLLRLSGPLAGMAAISVEAQLSLELPNRVGVCFCRGGWRGPKIAGLQRLELMKQLNQSFPAWLDITVLTTNLRVCRGNVGTIFALLKRDDLAISDFLPPSKKQK
ncbi:plastid lipid-associated protein (PAP)/fibrillin family [Synechococcus sp. A18-25c]|uniref:PAP/fibrillin family protein n=1 Tax=unclassified Synechococcus TaxID=2626047 RepID=UPI000C48D724|nr:MULTISPECIES: PAP/fibrillin family protein [unclassified Synechococcus]MAN18537.1 PAP fibrillin [Synechococcus sp. EAC657]QNI48304.1 plastid lipid-associated protein (PAP)/fibrillin family [Synechococcus sp. A15-60]QNJ19934.1 plastid lipid-associated protein (PAP)/fibrillin family [Synechococcus sp. A18-25c]|tara:strand:+ start:3015 stop:3554 length:540 start_codon:yes stop_codon:yes gene_type:complete